MGFKPIYNGDTTLNEIVFRSPPKSTLKKNFEAGKPLKTCVQPKQKYHEVGLNILIYIYIIYTSV